MRGIPTVEELGIKDWVPKHLLEDTSDDPEKCRSHFYNRVFTKSGRDMRDFRPVNTTFILVFLAPTILFTLLYGPSYAGVPYYMFIVWVHEAGHWIGCLAGNQLLCSTSGFFAEMTACLVPAALLLKNRQTLLAASVMLMCTGFSIQYTGQYMQTAENPGGAGFLGVRMTESTHDWSVIFRSLGLIQQSRQIGAFFEEVGKVFSMLFAVAAAFAIVPFLFGWVPKNLLDFTSPAALVYLLYYFFVSPSAVGVLVCIWFSHPLLERAVMFLRDKALIFWR